MSISRNTPYKYQANQKESGEPTRYSLPSRKKINGGSSVVSTPEQNTFSYIKGDLIKTVIVAMGIFLLELIIWWRMK